METIRKPADIRIEFTQRKDDRLTWTGTAYPTFGDPSPVAFVSITSGPAYVLLHSMVVHPSKRRRGIASQMVAKTVEHSRNLWPTYRIYLAAVPYGTEATPQEVLFRLYQKHGFVRTPGHPFELVNTPE